MFSKLRLNLNNLFNSRVARILHNFFLVSISCYGILLIFIGLPLHVFGQENAHDDLERRVTAIESQNLEHRMTVMETTLVDLQNSALWMRMNMAGTGLLIAEAVTRAVNKRKKEMEQ